MSESWWTPNRQLMLLGVTTAAVTVGAGVWRSGLLPFLRAIYREERDKEEVAYLGNLRLLRLPNSRIFYSRGYSSVCSKIEAFEARRDDIWVITYPKAGTTWTQEIVWLICNNADTEKARRINLEDRFPCLELPVPGVSAISNMQSPRFIKTHLPHGICPPDIWTKKCKVVYVTRNPKDVSVSVFHFCRLINAINFKGTFSDFFPLFAEKWIIYGGFWYHVLGFWKRRHEPNIFYITYEEMIKDSHECIRRIADFLGRSLTPEQVDAIAHHCSFHQMKNNPNANMSWMHETGMWNRNKGTLMRKGTVGDWMNHYTKEQSEKIDQLNKELLEPHGIKFVYEL